MTLHEDITPPDKPSCNVLHHITLCPSMAHCTHSYKETHPSLAVSPSLMGKDSVIPGC